MTPAWLAPSSLGSLLCLLLAALQLLTIPVSPVLGQLLASPVSGSGTPSERVSSGLLHRLHASSFHGWRHRRLLVLSGRALH